MGQCSAHVVALPLAPLLPRLTRTPVLTRSVVIDLARRYATLPRLNSGPNTPTCKRGSVRSEQGQASQCRETVKQRESWAEAAQDKRQRFLTHPSCASAAVA